MNEGELPSSYSQNKMVTRKQIWDKLDELEGKKKGSSYKNLIKEMELQGLKRKIKRKYPYGTFNFKTKKLKYTHKIK